MNCEWDFGGPLLQKVYGFDAVTAFGEESVEFLTVGVPSDVLERGG